MKNIQKSIVMASIFILFAGISIGRAEIETSTTTTTTRTTFRSDAPIYVGEVIVEDLRELTLGDFQEIGGTKPPIAAQNYQEYQKELDKPLPNPTRVPYKMRVTRVLGLADFREEGLADAMAQARYQAYINTHPLEGEDRYVYVLHTSVGHRPPA